MKLTTIIALSIPIVAELSFQANKACAQELTPDQRPNVLFISVIGTLQ